MLNLRILLILVGFMPVIAEVIVPLAVKFFSTYLVDEKWVEQAAPGKRVLVNFGKNKIYTGIIRTLKEISQLPDKVQYKAIEEILDDYPVLYEKQIEFYEWIAYYYMCTPGEVLKAALPTGLKPESALRVSARENIDWKTLVQDDKEYVLMEALTVQPSLSFEEIVALWKMINPSPKLRMMEARGYIRMEQAVEDRYKPKMKTFLKLSESLMDETAQQEALDSLSRAPSQENLLIRVVMAYHKDQLLSKKETLEELKLGANVAKELVKKGFIIEEEIQIDRLELHGYQHKIKHIAFTSAQEKALSEIKASISQSVSKPILLHGITGSGKTHLYIDLIREAQAQGKQALYLLPEITLTKQIIDRVKSELGESVGVYHSRFNEHERVEIWQKVLKGEYTTVIGVRSSIFLPFQSLGIIIVDEEHDHSFKQQEPAPRYNARDLAIIYAQKMNCPVILGSATPSFESYYNALSGKYTLVELHERAVKAQLPEIQLVDMRVQQRKKTAEGIFSSLLRETIQETLDKKEQIILFQNRRGYSPYLICETCGHVPQCINCDISLTYHKEKQHLRCHYCGYTQYHVDSCEKCGNFSVNKAGIGTEKIEEQVTETFQGARVKRMDWDTTRTKMGHHNIISLFETHQIDILVGTQMVSKGLDFEQVTLVGVINADSLLSFPDFRTFERAYQLLTQVSGRAGRSVKKGRVLIQTMMPDNIVLNSLNSPYQDFYLSEIPHRQQLGYPPFTRLIRIEIQHKERDFIEQESVRLLNLLKPYFGANLLGPEYLLVARVRNVFRMQFLIKISKNSPSQEVRDTLQQCLEQYYSLSDNRTLKILIDIDPM